MFDVINHESGLNFSVKTFRPLWIFPWHSSVWRKSPMPNCLTTVRYTDNKFAAAGHQELIKFVKNLKIGADMGAISKELEAFIKQREGRTIKSYRIWASDDLDERTLATLNPQRKS